MSKMNFLVGDDSLVDRVRVSDLRARLPYVALAILLAVALISLIFEVEHHISAIEEAISRLGPLGILVFVGFFAVGASCFIPDTILCVSAGVLFGLGWGSVAVAAGSLVASLIQYLLARQLLHDPIQRTLAAKPSLMAIQKAVHRNAFRLQVLLRLTPLNPATISYLLAAAGVRFSGFMVASLAMIPNLLLEVYLGHAAKHLARSAADDAQGRLLHDVTLYGGLAVGLIVMFFVSKAARQAVQEAIAEDAEETAERDSQTESHGLG